MTIKQYKEKPELVFWLDVPPHVAAGMLRYIAQEWGNKVFFLCARPLSKKRKEMGWEDRDHGEARVAILSELPDPDQFVKKFLQEHRGAIHICYGLRHWAAQLVKKHIFPVPYSKVAVWSERPGFYENRIKQFISWLGVPLLYRYYNLYYSSKIQVF